MGKADTLDLQTIDLFIDNQDVPKGNYTEVRDPGRLTDIVGRVAVGTVEDADRAVQSSHRAFQSWKKANLQERQQLLLKAADVIEREADTLVNILVREQGMMKSLISREIISAAAAIRNIVELSESFFEPKRYDDDSSWVSVEKRPFGVIAGIVPWNAPIILTMQKVAPALVAGNTIVIKPSPNAPLGVSYILKKIAGLFPPGVINVIHGEADVGSALNKHPLVRKISFTGGGGIAKFIMKDAAEGLKSVHFELGGNDPALILDDADPNEVIPKLLPVVFRRSGQVCFAIKRLYVPEKMYDTFYDTMCEAMDEYRIGHGLDERTTFGPLNNKNQYHFVKELIDRTKQTSAKVRELGQKLEPENWDNGYYLKPAIVRDVEPGQEIVTCEQFGPVIPLIPYRSEEEVLQMVNDTEYGLSSSVWSKDVEHANQIAQQIEAGMTYINGHGQTPLGLKYMPFGGVKQSGIGRENSEVGLAEYVEYHAINGYK